MPLAAASTTWPLQHLTVLLLIVKHPAASIASCLQHMLTVRLLQFEGDITALATKDNATFAAVGHNIVACQRVHQ